MTNYAILRVEKIHTRQQMRAAADHNNRTAKQGLEHTDPDGAAGVIVGQRDTVAAWDQKMADAGVDPKKQQKGAVLGLEWVASASPEWWANTGQVQREDWVADTMAFIQEQAGGKANILSAWWHDDEDTPHLHVVSIPLVEKERGARGRVRKGRTRPDPVKGWGLSAQDLIGGSKHRLVELQDDYAAAVAHHGLSRGIPRKETGERNKRPGQWRAEQARITDEMAEDGQAAKMARMDAAELRQLAVVEYRKTMAQAAAVLEQAERLGAAVREDAKAMGKAIHFPAYAEKPESAEARTAIRKAMEAQQAEADARKVKRLQQDRMAYQTTPQAAQGRERGR